MRYRIWLPVSENGQLPYWNSVSGFSFHLYVILHPLAKFRSNRSIGGRVMTSYPVFSAIFDLIWIVQLLVSGWSSNLVLIGFIVSEILQFLYFHVLACNCLFKTIFGGFPPNDVTHHPYPQKALPCAKTRRLSHKAWKSVQRFDLGAFPRKKWQDNQKKSQNLERSPYCANWNWA